MVNCLWPFCFKSNGAHSFASARKFEEIKRKRTKVLNFVAGVNCLLRIKVLKMSSSNDSSGEDLFSMMQCTPPEILKEAQYAHESLLPCRSKEKYIATYETFLKWKNSKNAKSFSENVFLAYFNELATKYKPSTLWSVYSMLKSTVRNKNNCFNK